MIRKADLALDIDSILELNKIISPDETKERLQEELSKTDGEIFIYEKEGRCVGFASFVYPFWNNIAIILHLSVEENERGQQIGTKLIESVRSRVIELEGRFLTVDTALWNFKAIKFYEKNGFTPRAVFPNYCGQQNDMVWLDMDLRES